MPVETTSTGPRSWHVYATFLRSKAPTGQKRRTAPLVGFIELENDFEAKKGHGQRVLHFRNLFVTENNRGQVTDKQQPQIIQIQLTTFRVETDYHPRGVGDPILCSLQ
jgi:hypothetical protein